MVGSVHSDDLSDSDRTESDETPAE